MGGHGGAKKKVKAALATVSTPTKAVTPAKAVRTKRAAPEPADEAAKPLKKQAKLPAHVPVGEEKPSKSAPERPVLNRKAADEAKSRSLKRERFGIGAPAGPGGAVVYLGHIPHGFYEMQMKGFFTQFGSVSRLRLARNRKTGRSKHYAFIEFEHREVAEVVAKAMQGYLLYSKILECRVLKPEEVRPKTFHTAQTNLQLVNRPIDQLRNFERKSFNEPRSEARVEKLAERRSAKARLRGRQWAKAGIEYDFEGIAPAEADGASKEQKQKQKQKPAATAAGKPAAKAAAKPKKASAAAAEAEPATAAAGKKAAGGGAKAGVKRAASADKPAAGMPKAAAAVSRPASAAKPAKRAKAA